MSAAAAVAAASCVLLVRLALIERTQAHSRGRCDALSPAAGGARRQAGKQIAEHVDALALPGDPRVTGTVVPAAVVGVPLCVLAVAGLLPAAITAAAVTAALMRAVATAPARRASAIDRELPVVLESVARHLRAGGSLAQALLSAGPREHQALAQSWERLRALVPRVGVRAAVEDWAQGCDRASVQLAAAALAVAAETGGSPARAVDGVAATLRSRRAVHDELVALTAQSRASAAVIAVAPVAFGVAAAAADRGTAAFFRTPAGAAVLLAGLLLDVIGALWMARLCRAPA